MFNKYNYMKGCYFMSKYMSFVIHFSINFFAVMVICLMFFISLDHIALAFILMMLVLYVAEYAEKKLTYNY